MNVGEVAAGVLRERDEATLICPIPDDKLLHSDSASVFVHVVLSWSCIGRSEFM